MKGGGGGGGSVDFTACFDPFRPPAPLPPTPPNGPYDLGFWVLGVQLEFRIDDDCGFQHTLNLGHSRSPWSELALMILALEFRLQL